MDLTVFDDSMLGNQTDLGIGAFQIRLHAHDLKRVRGNPGTALQGNRNIQIGSLVRAQGRHLVGPLLKSNLPGGACGQVSETLAGKVEVRGLRRMKRQGHGGQAVGGDAIGEIVRSLTSLAIFIHIEKARARLPDRHHVIKQPHLQTGRQAFVVYAFALDPLRGCKSVHVSDQLGDPEMGLRKDLIQGASNARLDGWDRLVHIRRHPRRKQNGRYIQRARGKGRSQSCPGRPIRGRTKGIQEFSRLGIGRLGLQVALERLDGLRRVSLGGKRTRQDRLNHGGPAMAELERAVGLADSLVAFSLIQIRLRHQGMRPPGCRLALDGPAEECDCFRRFMFAERGLAQFNQRF
jgi:hypothetical protein